MLPTTPITARTGICLIKHSSSIHLRETVFMLQSLFIWTFFMLSSPIPKAEKDFGKQKCLTPEQTKIGVFIWDFWSVVVDLQLSVYLTSS